MDIVRKSTVLSLADQVCSPIQSQTPAAAEIKLSSPLHCNGSGVRRPTKTALHQAVRDGRVHQARLLSASMKDIDIQDGNGWTPLMLTCTLHKDRVGVKLINMFIKRGAHVNYKDKMGRSPLMIACLMDKIEIVKRLLAEDGLELTTQDNDGNTALMHAALKTNASALKLILTKMTLFRLDVDARNRMGYTALLLACKQGNYQSALALVRMGNACPHLRDGEFKYNAKDWLLRFKRKQTRLSEERGRFPHLASTHKLTVELLPAEKSIETLLSKMYIPLHLRSDSSMLRSTPNIHITCQEPELDRLPQWEQEDKDHTYNELLREITKMEEDYDLARNRLIQFRSGRAGRRSYRPTRKREVATASLRAASGQTERYDDKRCVTLQYMFKLYALKCHEMNDDEIDLTTLDLGGQIGD